MNILFLNYAYSETSNCFPENHYLTLDFNPAKSTQNFSLNEFEANNIISQFTATWKSTIKEKLNKDLSIELDWENLAINATATRDMEDNLQIKIYGGMLRHPKQTIEGIYLVLCHELGHFLGGAPKSFRGRSKLRSWSSAEGQADYFASSKCMIKLFENGLFSKTYSSDNLACKDNYCHLITNSALSLGKIFASMRTDWVSPRLGKVIRETVSKTRFGHPNPQCRLDTFLAGQACREKSYIDFDDNNFEIGACTSTNEFVGLRPACWFSEAIH